MGPGVETVKSVRVSESGNVSLPLVGQVPAQGLTEAQLETAIQARVSGGEPDSQLRRFRCR